MTPDALKNLVYAAPFRAFTIHTQDGRSVPVPHPDFISISPTGRAAVVHTDGEKFEIIQVSQIAEATIEKGSKA